MISSELFKSLEVAGKLDNDEEAIIQEEFRGRSAATENRFVTTKGFKEDNLGSKVFFITTTLMLDVPDPSPHSPKSLINKEVDYEPYYRLTDKVLHRVFSKTEGKYFYHMAFVEKLTNGFKKDELPKQVVLDDGLLPSKLHTSYSMFETDLNLFEVSGQDLRVTYPFAVERNWKKIKPLLCHRFATEILSQLE